MGQWDPATRIFKSQEQLGLDAMLEEITDLADAPQGIIVLSLDHQKAMAMTEDDAATLATNLENQAPKPMIHENGDDVSDVTDNTGSTRSSKAARMTEDALKTAQKEHQLTLKEQAKSFALQRKEFEMMKAQLQQLQEQTTQNPPANQLTPDSATIHSRHDDVPESSPTDAAYDGEPEDDDSYNKSWGTTVRDDDDNNFLFADCNVPDPSPVLTPVPESVHRPDLTLNKVDIDLTNAQSGSNPPSSSSTNLSSESSSDPFDESNAKILPSKPVTATKHLSPFRKNRDLHHNFPPREEEGQDESRYQLCNKSAATTAGGPRGGDHPETLATSSSM